MSKREMRKWVTQHPFIPFIVKSLSGGDYDAFHPDYVHLNETSRELTIWTKDQRAQVIDVFLIPVIEQAAATYDE